MQVLSAKYDLLCRHIARRASIFLAGLLLVLASCLFTPAAHAQYRASIQGVVTDSQGLVVSGATVTLTDMETNKVLTTRTAGNGVYTFNALPPNRFSLAVEKAGFRKKLLSDLHLIPEQANALNVRLEVGESSQAVTVSGTEVPAMDTESASISGTVTSNEIQHLPSFGRDVFQLAQLAPGVFGDGAQAKGGGTNSLPGSSRGGSGKADGIFTTENAPQIIANGGQNETNGVAIDGITTTSAVWGGTSVITPGEDSVQSLKVVSNSYDAENGRFSGAQIQITTKSGTNRLHGSLFFKADRPGLNAYQRWNGPASLKPGTPTARGLQRDTSRFNQFGGSVGGPIWKNRLFGFFNYETLRNNTVSTGTAWYETPQFLKMAPTGSIAEKLLTYPGEGASYSAIISASCADAGLVEGPYCATVAGQGLDVGSPLKSALGTHDPSYVSTTKPGIGSGLDGVPDIAFVSTTSPLLLTETQYNGRADANVTSKDLVFGTIYWVPVVKTAIKGGNRTANIYHHNSINNAFSAVWNHDFSPSLLNEVRVNAAGWRWNEIATNPQEPFGLPTDNFGPGGNAYGSVTPGNFGAPGPSVFNQWTYGYQDLLTKSAGRHNLKFGGQLTRLYYLNEAAYNAPPVYNFLNVWDFLNDAPYSEKAVFDPLTGLVTPNRQDDRSNLYAVFAQDDFKIRSNLTLNLGLRYSYFGPMYAKQAKLSVAQLGSGASALTGLKLRIGGNLYHAQKGNFGPQFGFAWSPSRDQGRFVLRGGFGLNYNQEEIAVAASGNANPPGVVSDNLCCSTATSKLNTIVYATASDVHALYGYPPNPNTLSSFGPDNLPLTGAPIGVTAFPSAPATQYAYHYSLDTQYDLGNQWVATLGYLGSTARHLIQKYNYNVLAVATGTPLNPKLQSVDFFGNKGNSMYNAMLVGLKHQFAHSFLADAEYSWSKSMDDGSQPYYEDPYPDNPRAAWGRSDYNVGNAFKLYGMWQPRFFHGGHAWLEKVAGGWSVSGILNIHSGFPWTPTYNAPNLYYAGSGYGTLRPAAYLGGAGTDTSNDAFKSGPGDASGSKYNKNYPLGALAYFTKPASNVPSKLPAFPAAYGPPQGSTVARNTLNGPGYRDLDATLTKAFGLPNMPVLGESARFEVRADAFNLFNNLNLSGISSQITSSNFGQAQSALGSRTIELQARFSF